MNERIEPYPKMDKYAVFQNKLTGQSRMFKLQLIFHSSTLVNLNLTFQFAGPLREFLIDAQIFYMNPSTQVCQLLGTYPFIEDVFIEIDRRKRDKLYFKFRKIQHERPVPPQPAFGQTVPSLRKSKERTIGEVNHYLQSWKKVYNSPQQSGIPYTLLQAAEKVGLPKKTLDDYERQIRMAKAMNFDFESNKNAGMGVIRNFVRMQGNSKGQQLKKQQILQPQFFLNIGRPPNR